MLDTNKNLSPLADRMRPETLDEFLGQTELVGAGTFLQKAIQADTVPSVITTSEKKVKISFHFLRVPWLYSQKPS